MEDNFIFEFHLTRKDNFENCNCIGIYKIYIHCHITLESKLISSLLCYILLFCKIDIKNTYLTKFITIDEAIL